MCPPRIGPEQHPRLGSCSVFRFGFEGSSKSSSLSILESSIALVFGFGSGPVFGRSPETSTTFSSVRYRVTVESTAHYM